MSGEPTRGFTRRAWLMIAAAGGVAAAGAALVPGLRLGGDGDAAITAHLRAAIGAGAALDAIGRVYRAAHPAFRPRSDFDTLLGDLGWTRAAARAAPPDAVRARLAAPGLPVVSIDGFVVARPLALLAALGDADAR